MLAYTANMPRAAGRTGSPNALILVIAGHALALAGVLTARPDLTGLNPDKPPVVINIPDDPPPPEHRPAEPKQAATQERFIPAERPIIDMERQDPIEIATGPSFEDIGTVIGSGPTSTLPDPSRHVPVMSGPRLATSDSALKPPSPNDKLRAVQEATLTLWLSIDARGRVIAVDPVGAADPSFLEAARRHILRVWRYKPATEDGAAIQSTTVISLSFRLEDV